MNIEIGQYVNNGYVDLIVGDIREYKGKTYAFLIDEKNELSYFCELERKEDGWNFNRVTSDALTKQLIIHFSDIETHIKNGNFDDVFRELESEAVNNENRDD